MVGRRRSSHRAIVFLLVTVLTGPWSFARARVESARPASLQSVSSRPVSSTIVSGVASVEARAAVAAPAFRLDDQEPGEVGDGAESSQPILFLAAGAPSPLSGSVVAAAHEDGRRSLQIERLCRFRC